MTTYESLGNFPDEDTMRRILARIDEDNEVHARVRAHKWAQKSHREKAEALIARVDPDFVQETDLRKIALAQVHATLSLKEG